MESGLTKAQIISTLTKSPHGKLAEYVTVAQPAAEQDPDFVAHLIAWNRIKGQIRDAKVALPVVALAAHPTHNAHLGNALAHVALSGPREFARAMGFARDLKVSSRLLRRLVARYLKDLEAVPSKWERIALQHRHTLKALYATYHVDTTEQRRGILFENRPSGVFQVVRELATLTPEKAGAAIAEHRIPFLIAKGALGKRLSEPAVLLAVLQRMTPNEVVSNTKMLQTLGVMNLPALRAAYEQQLEKIGKSGSRGATLKTTVAAEAVEDDNPTLTAKLKAAQERQLDKLQTIQGNWLVLADKSGSMELAIETSLHVAAVLARMVKGSVHLVFFDVSPRYLDVTGKTLDEIRKLTAGVTANGGTAIGCGLRAVLDRKLPIDGIAIVSDGAENASPFFGTEYKAYRQAFGTEPTVYWYKIAGHAGMLKQDRNYARHFQMERDGFLSYAKTGGADVQIFDLEGGVDYYSLPNVIQTMRVGRYSLLDEIYATPLLTLDDVLSDTKGMKVITTHVEAAQVA